MTERTGVRYRQDVGWELRCESCAVLHGERYWPLTLEFWDPRHGMSRCRACWVAYARRLRARSPHQDYARAEAVRRYQREWAARKRAQQRADEGRRPWQRRKIA
jgi:hypothetical protein